MREASLNQVFIFDTTLRDGEQSPGASLTSTEKLEVARGLSRLGADVIEAGFPASSPDELHAVQKIAEEVGNRPAGAPEDSRLPPVICGLARAVAEDIEKAWEAVRAAARPRIHTFIATSDIHLKHKLRMTREQVLQHVHDMVAFARALCEDVEFSAEDASRSDIPFLCAVLETAIHAGATTVNIPDTVGYAMPGEFEALLREIRASVAGIEKVVLSVHCHDDLGLATANTLAGIRAGARQAEVTVNGIGERAGNTSLEEVVMAIHTRRDLFGLSTSVDTTQISRVSRLVSHHTGIVVPPNKAIVGANAFAHEAGIHQDGMLKNHQTYEIMRPESIGLSQSRLVLGKHSGRHGFQTRLRDLGYELGDEELLRAFERFKALADKKKIITDADLEALIADELYQPEEVFALEGLQVACGTMGMPTATIRLRGPEGAVRVHAAVGTGPIDAAFKAIDEIIRAPNRLLEFSVHAVTEGIDAQGAVTVRIQDAQMEAISEGLPDAGDPRTYTGYGADTDIIVASVKAFLSAMNKLLIARAGARRLEWFTNGMRSSAPQPFGESQDRPEA